jgi:hypothetical protein
MESYGAHYRGYEIEAELDGRWLVRVQPTRPDLPILAFSTFRVPHAATLTEALDDARARIDAVLTVGELNRERRRSGRDPDHAT